MIKIIFPIIIISLLFISTDNISATTIPQEVKDVVTFIFIKNDSGQVIPNGTGFFVGIKDENDPNIFDCKWIPVDMITTKEIFKESRIREGDDVFFIGLFPYYGNQRNYPITRFGRVALITDEKIPWKDKKEEVPKMLDLYLVESQSFGGNSGSPVFFYLNATREPGSIVIGAPTLLLAGVMKGCYLDAKEIQVAETSKIPISLENVGIAAVVPAYRLYELLFSDELKKIRPEKKVK